MFAATLFTAALFIVPAAAALSIETPKFVQCQDAKIKWAGNGDNAINVIVVPAADACGDVIHDLGDHGKSSMTWKVALPAGAKVLLSLEGANEEEAWTEEVVVGPSDDSSCVPKELLALGAVISSSVAPTASASSVASVSASASAAARTTLSVVGNVGAAAPKASIAATEDKDNGVTAVGAIGDGIIKSGASQVAPFTVLSAAMAAIVAFVL